MNVMTARRTVAAEEGFLAPFLRQFADRGGNGGVRAAAADWLRTARLPGRHDEAWHYTGLQGLAPIRFGGNGAADAGLMALLPVIDAPTLLFVNGVLDAAHSTAVNGARGEMKATLEPGVFAALNTMLAEDGARVVVPAKQDGGVLVVASVATAMTACHPRHSIRLEAGARLTLVEIVLADEASLHNQVCTVVLEDGARMEHVRLQQARGEGGFCFGAVSAEVAAGARYDSFLLNLGTAFSRNEVRARIGGDAASVQLNCAQLLRGRQLGDFTTRIVHDAPAGRSRQTVRNVLDEASRGVFQGRIDVARVAQKTDGYQMNHALLLSAQAEMDSKPELRINADDVKCSHGATVGELDSDQLFYLRSRGVPEAEARAMLIRGFLAESLAEIEHEPTRALFDRAVDGWWEQGAP